MDALVRRTCGTRRTVKPCGSGSPTLESSEWKMIHSRWWLKSPAHQEEHGAAVEPLRRECRMISAYLCWPRVRFFCLHARQWVRSCTRHSLRPLVSRERPIDASPGRKIAPGMRILVFSAVVPRAGGAPSIPEASVVHWEAAAYWIARLRGR